VIVVAGLSLKNLQPRVWDTTSPYYLPNLQAVMVSYADFVRRPARRRAAMLAGLHAHLGVPARIPIFLDNGAFYFLGRDDDTSYDEYERFVIEARPDWWPIPRDFIPTPAMSHSEQRACLRQTMKVNLTYRADGYVPVIHIGTLMPNYLAAVRRSADLRAKPTLALGGIVPNLLRAPKAVPYADVISGLRAVRSAFPEKRLHVFGVGGTATLHLMALFGIDSIDSSGWRNRAARGIVQLPGRGDRMVANLGSWRGREPSAGEWDVLRCCPCPACLRFGPDALLGSGIAGFCARATHNLWVLLHEAEEIEARLGGGSYLEWYQTHLDNSIYLPLVRQAAEQRARHPSLNDA
jgi:hypothetical protein